jgi:Flp pilus assembly secretin CpaC
VNERLSDDYYLDASDIEVSVQGGTVTLSGEVDDRESKRRAEDIAEFCSGVQQVQNNIKVKSGGLTGWLFGNGSDESETQGSGTTASSTQSTTSGTSSKKASSGS